MEGNQCMEDVKIADKEEDPMMEQSQKENQREEDREKSMEDLKDNLQDTDQKAENEMREDQADSKAADTEQETEDIQEEESKDCAADDETDEQDGDADAGEASKEDVSDDAAQGAEKKGFFKKNKKKDKKDEKIEELTDQVKRQMAEFDNFRKRTEKEKTQMYEIGAKSIIEKVLPVVDNFERGLAAVPEESKEDAFVDGMSKVYKQLMTMLEEADVHPIEAIGKEFDPNLHNAVMQTESDEYDSGIVAQELQKGYMYRDSVVRHSMVAVVS